ncbi:MAG: AAA family ATPase [Planctomycetaceae bacterium]|nr:AAA family ATPase [Planctomycetaceae bacterium]
MRILEYGTGIVLVFGENGTGKSLLLKKLEQYFENNFCSVYISNTRLRSPKSFYQHLLFSLHQSFCGIDENELRLLFLDYLRQEESTGIILLIDEAQTLSNTVLEELRILQDYDNGKLPLVRLALAGNRHFEERLTHPCFTAFQQRVVARCYLENFSREETCGDIVCQLKNAGCANPKTLFSENAQKIVYELTNGVPRIVHQLCDESLTLAVKANLLTIDEDIVQSAWEVLQQLPAKNTKNEIIDEPNKNNLFTQNETLEFGLLDDKKTSSKNDTNEQEENLLEPQKIEIIPQEPFMEDDVEFHSNSGENHSDSMAQEFASFSVKSDQLKESPPETFSIEHEKTESNKEDAILLKKIVQKKDLPHKFSIPNDSFFEKKVAETIRTTPKTSLVAKNESCQKLLDELMVMEELLTQEISVIHNMKKLEKECSNRQTHSYQFSQTLASFPEMTITSVKKY